jgi:hypothetical protein
MSVESGGSAGGDTRSSGGAGHSDSKHNTGGTRPVGGSSALGGMSSGGTTATYLSTTNAGGTAGLASTSSVIKCDPIEDAAALQRHFQVLTQDYVSGGKCGEKWANVFLDKNRNISVQMRSFCIGLWDVDYINFEALSPHGGLYTFEHDKPPWPHSPEYFFRRYLVNPFSTCSVINTAELGFTTTYNDPYTTYDLWWRADNRFLVRRSNQFVFASFNPKSTLVSVDANVTWDQFVFPSFDPKSMLTSVDRHNLPQDFPQTFSVPADGQWLLFTYPVGTAYTSYVLPIDVRGFGQPMLLTTTAAGAYFYWAPDGTAVTFVDTNKHYVTYRLASGSPLLLPDSGLSEQGDPTYSKASKFLLWPKTKNTQVPVQSLTTGKFHSLTPPDSNAWTVVGTSTNDSYLLLTSQGQLGYALLRNADGSEVDQPVIRVLLDVGANQTVTTVTSIHAEKELIYGVMNTDTKVTDYYWVSLENPQDSNLKLTETLGTNYAINGLISPREDYVAFPTERGVYLAKLARPLTVQAFTEELSVTHDNEPMITFDQQKLKRFAWTPDGLDFIVAAVVPDRINVAIWQLPRLSNPNDGFGPVRKIVFPTSHGFGTFSTIKDEYSLELKMPRDWANATN